MKLKPGKLWTPKDLADYLSVKESVVRYWVRNQEVPHIRIGRHVRFDPEDILEWIAAKGNAPRFPDTRELRRV
ncbi:MAG: helix-turn-helix domain-containing protein [Proteobacteria bacterium]|nr:helix-turn-helix domain-containing protein [Pseudomonadota bacterium]